MCEMEISYCNWFEEWTAIFTVTFVHTSNAVPTYKLDSMEAEHKNCCWVTDHQYKYKFCSLLFCGLQFMNIIAPQNFEVVWYNTNIH